MSSVTRRFTNDVVNPFRSLIERASQPVVLAADTNDLMSRALSVAIAAHHFPEATLGKINAGAVPANEELREKLRDVADTAKHGALRKPERSVRHELLPLAYEFNAEGRFRFLGCEIRSSNERFGAFNLIETITAFVAKLIEEFNLSDVKIPKMVLGEFLPYACVVGDQRSAGALRGVNFNFLTRDGSGTLVLADPPMSRIALSSGTIDPSEIEQTIQELPETETKIEVQHVAVTRADGGLSIMQIIIRAPLAAFSADAAVAQGFVIGVRNNGEEYWDGGITDEGIAAEIAQSGIKGPTRWRRIDRSELLSDRSRRDDWIDTGSRIEVGPPRTK